METLLNILTEKGFGSAIRSTDGNYILMTHPRCEAAVAVIFKEGKTRFKVEGHLPQSMVAVSTDYLEWAERESLLWKCVNEIHTAINTYKLSKQL